MTSTSTSTPTPTTPARRSGFLGDTRGWFRQEGLVRPREGRWIGGVCRGIADRYGVDPLIVRGATLLSFLLPGPQILAYGLLWVLLPLAETSVGASPISAA